MADLNRKLGAVEQDNLITATDPAPIIGHATIRKATEKKVYKRGTILALDSTDNKCVILAEGAALTANCVLCDDITVGSRVCGIIKKIKGGWGPCWKLA